MVPPRRHGGLFVLLARRVSDRAPLFSRGVRHVRQILNPLRDIRHALNRRDVHAERPRRPEKVRTIIRRQKPMRPRGERQFARRHVRHDLVVRGASDPFVAGQATTHPLVPSRPAEPVLHRRDFGPRWPRGRADATAAGRSRCRKPRCGWPRSSMAHRDTSVSALCRELGINPVTLYRYVGPQGDLEARTSSPLHVSVG